MPTKKRISSLLMLRFQKKTVLRSGQTGWIPFRTVLRARLSCKESEIGGRPREAPFSSFVPCLGVCSLAGSCTWSPPQARVCTRTPPCPSQPALPKCPALAAPVLRQQRCTEAHPRVQGSLWGVRYFPVHCGALPGVQVHSPWCPWWAISVQG